ncbi:2-amino-4-hydroxy-6-hydroxymethyldihydropteridine diphosphokinase [Agaribacter flavus]|uniref:2-amino-4-hydroxy-6-hydroxymethyldihydropteridine diphosphokinase n=1 Tax=Agaribacter flavus TaxID=1902781 RepID=A0ABV7FQC4_9ALTE
MSSIKHAILISVGSNIDKERNTQKGLDELHAAFGQLDLSPIYETESVGFTSHTFLNLVVGATTSANIAEVVQTLKVIETKCGRTRHAEKFSDRTLDLDLLTYDEVVCDFPVVLPREEILFNAFVLKPMADIVPEQIHPKTKKTYAQLWQAFDKSAQRLWPSTFTWSNTAK